MRGSEGDEVLWGEGGGEVVHAGMGCSIFDILEFFEVGIVVDDVDVDDGKTNPSASFCNGQCFFSASITSPNVFCPNTNPSFPPSVLARLAELVSGIDSALDPK